MTSRSVESDIRHSETGEIYVSELSKVAWPCLRRGPESYDKLQTLNVDDIMENIDL
jgi:hypothetical protein